MGWLSAELEQRFSYSLDELERRFDRSVGWISRRLALMEALPEAIQQQVREGKIPAQVAMKFLVPVARQSLEDCQRMASIFTQHHCDTCEAGRLAPGVASDPQTHPRVGLAKRKLIGSKEMLKAGQAFWISHTLRTQFCVCIRTSEVMEVPPRRSMGCPVGSRFSLSAVLYADHLAQ